MAQNKTVNNLKVENRVDDANGNVIAQSVVDSNNVTLSTGDAVIDTGISTAGATFYVPFGISDPDADTKVSVRQFWDDSAGTYKVEFVEQGTSVGNPTVNYDIIRVR